MTDKQKNQIAEYREQGMSYTEISKKMDLSINSIKTYCKRHGLGGVKAYEADGPAVIIPCQHCGAPVKQNPGRKQKRFCSDKCRNLWWNSHMDLVQKKANYECTCIRCGKKFTSYGNKERKYCSHSCYIEDRFGGAY